MEKAFRPEFRQFSASCERVLALAAKGAILTDEEQDMVRYYVSELSRCSTKGASAVDPSSTRRTL